MKLVVNYNPFQIIVINCEEDGEEFKVWETAVPGIFYTPNGELDYSIIQSFNMPATSQYFGFGEQGGRSLNKDTTN